MTWLATWWPRFGRGPTMMRSVDEALATAAQIAPAGFRAIDAVIAEDGRTALVLAADGRIVVVRTAGRRAALREIDWAMLRQTGDGVVAETGDRRLGDVLLRGVTAIDVRRLGGSDAVADAAPLELADA